MRSSSTRTIVFILAVVATFCPSVPSIHASDDDELKALSRDYARYRERARSPANEFEPDLRSWDGPYVKIMHQLGERLGDGTHTERDVLRLMGEPDKRVRAGEWSIGGRVPRHETHLYYWWRGAHDFLYFVVEGGTVKKSRWYLAYE
jgi:hypothetical protein